MQLQNWIPAPKRKKKMHFFREHHQCQKYKTCCQITIAALMQPLQYDPQCPAAKDNSISHAAAAPSKHDAAVTMSYRDIEFQNTLEEKYEQTREKFQLQNPLSGPKQKNSFLSTLFAPAACHRRLQPLYTEKHKVSCSGFLSNTSPMQHARSRYNAMCNLRFNTRIELRA